MPTLVTTRERERGYKRDELETTVNLIETRFTHSPQWGNDCRREKMWLSLVMGGRCGIWRNKSCSRYFGAHVSDHVYYQRQDVYKCILVWQLSNKAADKTDPFIRRRLPPRSIFLPWQNCENTANAGGSLFTRLRTKMEAAQLWNTSNCGPSKQFPETDSIWTHTRPTTWAPI